MATSQNNVDHKNFEDIYNLFKLFDNQKIVLLLFITLILSLTLYFFAQFLLQQVHYQENILIIIYYLTSFIYIYAVRIIFQKMVDRN